MKIYKKVLDYVSEAYIFSLNNPKSVTALFFCQIEVFLKNRIVVFTIFSLISVFIFCSAGDSSKKTDEFDGATAATVKEIPEVKPKTEEIKSKSEEIKPKTEIVADKTKNDKTDDFDALSTATVSDVIKPKIDDKIFKPRFEKKETKIDTDKKEFADTRKNTKINVSKNDTTKTDLVKTDDTKTKTVKNDTADTTDLIPDDKNKNEVIENKINEEIVIELKNVEDKDKKIYQNFNKESSMIIFENSASLIPPSLTYEYDDDKLVEITDYELDSFIPRTSEQFDLANPKYSFDNNGVIMRSKIVLYTPIGETMFRKAYKFFQNDELKNAKILFLKLVHYNYRVSESSYFIGLCLHLLKDNILAIKYLKSSIFEGEIEKLSDTKISNYYNQLAKIYYDLSEYDQAISNYLVSLEKDPKNNSNYNGIGLSYYKLGNIQKTLEYWQKGSFLGNKDCEANYKWLSQKLSK